MYVLSRHIHQNYPSDLHESTQIDPISKVFTKKQFSLLNSGLRPTDFKTFNAIRQNQFDS